jgi:triphosphoribosyl-dephospho-CoA synthase
VVAEALRIASIAEVQAFKPGNVSLASPGHGMRAEDFVASADAVATVIAVPGLGVGGRILRAIQATRAVVAFNTNLGIVLLCAPLAHAALLPAVEPGLRGRLRAVLAQLGVEDASYLPRNTAGTAGELGSSRARRVHGAIRDAAGSDAGGAVARRIARQYATGFEDVRVGHRAGARGTGAGAARNGRRSPFLCFLARFPTVMSRKHGDQVAREVVSQRKERHGRCGCRPSCRSDAGAAMRRMAQGALDQPGDHRGPTVASLFAVALEDLLDRV